MQKHISLEARVQNLDYSEPWKLLTEKEKNYAYFLSKASWAGARIVLHQVSYETPAIFLLFQTYFQEKDFHALELHATAAGITSEAWKNFLAYAAGFYGNMGNYHSFGNNKFIPTPELDKGFLTILQSHPLYSEADSDYKNVIDHLYPLIEKEIFTIEKPYTDINFPEQGGVTGYFSRNMVASDLALVKEFLIDQKIDILNTRAFKKADRMVITVGSISSEGSKTDVEFKGQKFDI